MKRGVYRIKNFRKIAVVVAIILVIGATSVTALAVSGYGTPAEIVAGLTGESVDSVIAEKTDSGKTYGAIAEESGKLTEFKAQMLEQKKAILTQRVAAGTMTQERADAILSAKEENQANCDGACTGGTGCNLGARFGWHERFRSRKWSERFGVWSERFRVWSGHVFRCRSGRISRTSKDSGKV